MKPWVRSIGRFFALLFSKIASVFRSKSITYLQTHNSANLFLAPKPARVEASDECDKAAISAATTNWSSFAGRTLFSWDVKSPAYITVSVSEDIPTQFVAETFYSNSSPKILIREAYKSAVITIEHELGHALGFDHTLNTNSIMFPTYWSKQKFTPEIKQVLNEMP